MGSSLLLEVLRPELHIEDLFCLQEHPSLPETNERFEVNIKENENYQVYLSILASPKPVLISTKSYFITPVWHSYRVSLLRPTKTRTI